MFSRWFGRKKQESEDEEQRFEDAWYERKSKLMERILGKEHEYVLHALIPYHLGSDIGGALDLYLYPHSIPGTAIATKELSLARQPSPANNVYESYELVMFTREPLEHNRVDDHAGPFGSALNNMNTILNLIARYSAEATLNPGDTCEFPETMEVVGGKCLIFDAYDPCGEASRAFGLMAVIEVFRSEMNYARAHGGAALIDKLKTARVHPYSDLGRAPVA